MEELKVLQSKLKAQLPDLELREQEPMRLHTTFRVGGPASLMALPRARPTWDSSCVWRSRLGSPPSFWGRAPTFWWRMRGWTAFSQLAGGLNRLERAEGTAIYVGSGVTLAQAAVFAAHHGLTGLEFAHGIPGTMGGGVFMSAVPTRGRWPKSLIGWTAWTRRACPAACPGRPWHWVTAAAFSPAALADYRGTPDAGAGRPCGHPGENGRPVPPPPGPSSPWSIPAREAPLSARPAFCRGFN